ncbi:MAG: PAS domain S-box protein [Candidatus Omnitrophica bacterium]|nr:PAS domain S-box protein [Candidatus Omnitrophota bacterium]
MNSELSHLPENIDFETIFNLSPTGIVILDLNGIVVGLNNQICTWLEYKREDILGKNLLMLRSITKSSKMVILEKLSQRLDGEPVEPYEIQFRTKRGNRRLGWVTETAVKDKNGNLDCILVVISDITVMRHGGMDDGIMQYGNIYQAIFDHSAIGIMIGDEEEKIVSWNDYAQELLGMEKNDLKDKPIRSLYPKDEWEKMKSLNIRKEDRRQDLTVKMYKKNGTLIDVDISISALKDSDGNVKGSIGVLKNITKRKSAEKEATKANELYKTIFENSAVGITIVDQNDKVISWNKFAEQLLTRTGDQFHNLNVRELYPSDQWQLLKEKNIREKGIQEHFETKMIKGDGKTVDVDISITVLKEEDNNTVAGAIGIFRDITERKKIQEELELANKMKNDFMSMVSHELRTPLTSINGSLGIVLEGSTGELNEEQKEFLTTAHRNVQRLDILIGDVLLYQRLLSGRAEFSFEENDINALIEVIKNDFIRFADEKKIEMILNLTPELPVIHFDKSKISKVLTDLIDNALKFTESGSVTITSKQAQNDVVISVKDTGIGIKHEDTAKVFDSFSQLKTGSKRKPGSTGLGLAIARSIVENHEGRIWVDSKEGEGSDFQFTIPLKMRDL